jgi:nicotinamidase/pyrazinamidase
MLARFAVYHHVAVREPLPMNTATSHQGRSGLLIVDVQNDFCAGGALAVPDSARVILSLNRRIEEATAAGVAIFASRDWHPALTTHFTPFGGPWPVHCVAGTTGARFHSALCLPSDPVVVSKGQDPDSTGYSAFEGRTADGTLLGEELRKHGITHLYVGGLATDYCVRHSVLDALAAGLRVTVLADAIAGVDVHPGDAQRAIEEMRITGAEIETP